jgi:NAD(P)-dependent dehydrogenase (short-subunit alcohol dehydrogenase family)
MTRSNVITGASKIIGMAAAEALAAAGWEVISVARHTPANFEVAQRLVVGDRVVSHPRFTGHFTGTFQGVQGHGQAVDFIATDILRIQRGRITDNWRLEDNLTLDDFPNLRRWFDTVRARPGTQRAYAKGEPYSSRPTVTEEGKKILFGQTASRAPAA